MFRTMNRSVDGGTFLSYVTSRVGHVAVADNDFMLVWGGYTEEVLHERYLPSKKIDVFHTDLDEGYWTSHETQGDAPPGTSGAVAILVKHNLYIFGGHTESGSRGSNDLYCCDLRSLTWEKIKPKSDKLPSPRDKLIGCHVNNRLYYFGGYGIDMHDQDFLVENGKFVLDFSQNNSAGKGWNNQLLVYDIEEKTWSNPACKGFAPSGRAAHAAMLLGTSIYIFGGRHQEIRLNDLHCLDISTLTWSGELHIEGAVPAGRSWHTLTAISEDRGFLYGGYSHDGVPLSDAWLLDVTQRQWSQVTVPSNEPRLWHTCCCTETGDVLVFGGCESDILNWQEKSIHSNEVLTFRLQPSTLQRLCLLVTYKSYMSECWNELPKALSDWLHKKRKLELMKQRAPPDGTNLKQGSTCVIS